jgi:voltage-gated sodium channel
MGLVTSTWQDKFMAIRSNKIFELSVIAIIIVSALMIGVSTYDMDLRWESVIYVVGYRHYCFLLD